MQSLCAIIVHLPWSFRVLEHFKTNAEYFISCLTHHYAEWYEPFDPTARDEVVFMQENLTSQAEKKTRAILEANGFFGKQTPNPKDNLRWMVKIQV